MRIILLDLNYTLVSNSEIKINPFENQIKKEQYRTDLIYALRNDYVVLITARPERYKKQTLDSLKRKAGFTPHSTYFNGVNLPPPQCKEYYLKNNLLNAYNKDAMLAIESNPRTRAMYKRYNIKVVTYKEFMEL